MTDDSPSDTFTPEDDGPHPATGDFYETETFWYSFFVPERGIGGWLYTSLRATAGVCAGGAWIWDGRASEPWRAPFFEQFSWLKYPDQPRAPQRLDFPTGMTIEVRDPLRSYDVSYNDRDRLSVELHFEALEPPVPLRAGAPPYPKAHHFDQTGHVTGTIRLDGEQIAVDCYAMRDRSWGRRTERGYSRVGYAWAASPELSLLTYSLPTDTSDNIHSGYLRIGDEIAYIADGRRIVERDPSNRWVTRVAIDATDELGRQVHAEGRAVSRLILPGSTSICVNTSLEWIVDGTIVHGEDQDVWPTKAFSARTPIDKETPR